MNNGCIGGAGIHPFGRHDGKTGLDLGVFAIREALSDAGLDWTDMQFGFGGSYDSGDADAVLPVLGRTGMQFINVANGCATGGSALLSGDWGVKAGACACGGPVGFGKQSGGALDVHT